MKPLIEKIDPPGNQCFACRWRRDPRFDFSWHYHPELELTWIARSRGRRYVGDHIEDYRDGDLILLGPNLPHTWASAADVTGGRIRRHEAVIVQFREDFLGETFFEHAETRAIGRLFDRAIRGLKFGPRTAETVTEAMRRLPGLEGPARLIALLQILARLAAARDVTPLASEGFLAQPTATDSERIDRVCQYVHRHLAEPFSQTDAAAVAHLSPAAFSRFFKRATGRTFVAYVNDLRVGEACRLLMESDRSIAEVCFDVGFSSLSNFNRRFRQLKGMTPRDYRRQFH